MIVIFAGLHEESDSQVLLVTRLLRMKRWPCIVLSPYSLREKSVALTQSGNQLSLQINGKTIVPTAFYIANLWRTDSTICLSKKELYPGVYRSQLHQFLQDIRFACEICKWIPGRIEAIERGDSKPYVLACAHKAGLTIPSLTQNAFRVSVPFKSGNVFKKKLGYPFVVSINRKKGAEVGVTTENTEVVWREARMVHGEPWQWQEVIRASFHVRCCVIGNSVWAVKSDFPRKYGTIDLRHLNEMDEEVTWTPYCLPGHIANALIRLLRSLELSNACPEFLIRDDGVHVFVDLNPCGDWAGFFSKKTNWEIANEITSLCHK